MPLHLNNQILINRLESIDLLDNRYEKIKVINYDPEIDKKQGCFSLVFRAFDTLNKKVVALKFFDIDPIRMMDRYRQASFHREHEILQILLNKNRCLQLVSDFSTFELELSSADGNAGTLPCNYFAVEWLEDDIDDFFLGNNSSDPVQKLKLFNNIVLSVESLHRHEIYHRDIKADNLRLRRAYQNSLKSIVVAIDLGTAARFTSNHVSNNYTQSVGALGYAAPEACCGLAGNRFLAPFTDKYALGCLLFELFNYDYFYRELTRCNPRYAIVIHGMSVFLSSNNDKKQLINWEKAVAKFGAGIAQVDINSPGSIVPLGVTYLLNDVLSCLTHVNYAKRPTLEWVRKRITSAIAVLENDKFYQHKLRLTMTRRENRQRNVERAQAKLNEYLMNRNIICKPL